MPFGIWTQVGPTNHVLNWGPDRPMRRRILGGKDTAVSCEKWLNRPRCRFGFGLGPRKHVLHGGAYWRYLAIGIETSMFGGPEKTAEPIVMPFELWTRVDPRKHVSDGDPDPHANCDGAISG